MPAAFKCTRYFGYSVASVASVASAESTGIAAHGISSDTANASALADTRGTNANDGAGAVAAIPADSAESFNPWNVNDFKPPSAAQGCQRSVGMNRIEPQQGIAFKIRQGEVLRVVDPYGEQVSDLFAFRDGDLACALSSGRTIDYAGKLYLSTGDVLYSNDSRRMFTIVDDTVGRHDFLLTPCSQQMFEILYKCQGHHASCFENLCDALEPHGVKPAQISTTFNIFMNVRVDPGGGVSVEPPTSKPGDFIELRAEMDMVCALTACSAEQSNNGTFKPIDYEIMAMPCV